MCFPFGHRFHEITYAAQRASAAAVVFVLKAPVVDTLRPRVVPYVLTIPTFSLSRDSGARLYSHNDVARGRVGTLALPAIERIPANVHVADNMHLPGRYTT
jgi:hypothetical protein